MIASMTVGKDVRCVAALCRGCLGQTAPGGCPDGLRALVFPSCLRGVFALAFVSGGDRASCWPQLHLRLCKRGHLAGGGLPGFGSNLAERGLVWLPDKFVEIIAASFKCY